eukprot:475028_1
MAKWITLSPLPHTKGFDTSIDNELVVPTGMNKDNFIALQIDENAERITSVHKYNIDTNKWKTIDVSDSLISCTSYTAAVVSDQNLLYFLYENYLIQMELNSKTVTQYLLSSENYHNYNSQCVILNNELFVIGGDKCHSISKWNAETKQLTPINNIYNKTKLDVFGWTYDNNTNCVLIFGGYDNNTNNNNNYVDYILQYDVTKNESNKLPISLPIAMCNVCCLNAINNNYVLIFGGYNGVSQNDIYIYSIKTQTITKSKIKCPTKNKFGGIIVNDKMKDEKAVF